MHHGLSTVLTVFLISGSLTSQNYNVVNLPNPPSANRTQCQLVNSNDRLDCFPRGDATQELCEARGCCWAEDVPDVPYCFFQPNYPSYTFKNITELPNGVEAFMERSYSSPYPKDVVTLKLVATYQSDDILRVKIIDPLTQRYESLFPKVELPAPESKNPKYKLIFAEDNKGFKITRRSDNTIIFDASDMANFIYSDQFIQITTKIPSTNIYGIGEHRERLRLPTNWSSYSLFSRDNMPLPKTNLYGSHPFYMLIEDSTKTHGVFLKNSNAMEIIIQPSPALTYRTIGGILDFYFFLGPTPSDVLKQYQEVIGKPKMPPYWSLGFHLSRYGIKNVPDMKNILQRNWNAGIPIETQWNDLDYMDSNNDFTYNNKKFEGLPEFVKELHSLGRRYVILIDPGVGAAEPKGTYPPYDKGIEMDIFIKNSTGDVLLAKVWNPDATAFPDFTNPKTYDYWKHLLKAFHDVVPFDGAWLDMNEPANFNDGSQTGCPENELENPPYVPRILGDVLRSKTVCMTAKQYAGVVYDLHNLYGISEASVTSQALSEVIGERSLVIARSTFPGSGVYAGHWSGDINSSWDDLIYTIPELLDFSLFGIPLMGADICGFGHDSNEDLCNRWMQLGAFYPFSRNHNTIYVKDQDPVAMGEQVTRSSRKALRIRYALLPYLYTLFWQANQNGTTVARPLFIEFPEDKKTYDIDTSFLWGSGLLIVPVLESDPASISTYLPKGIWYNYYTRQPLYSDGRFFDIKTDKDTIPLFLHGGNIIPIQSAENTTEEVRNSKYGILAALDQNGEARGQFYWDDGISVDVGNDYTLLSFKVENSTLTIETLNQGTVAAPKLFSVEILGLNEIGEMSFIRNNQNYTYRYDKKNQNLQLGNLDLDEYPVTISWR